MAMKHTLAMATKHTLVTGGIRSGKTALAEQIAMSSDTPVTYIATATAGDGEMTDRIRRHQAERPESWGLIEAPLGLARALEKAAEGNSPLPCLLIDCMSLWVSNLLHAGEQVFNAERKAFQGALAKYPGEVIIVSNEVGLSTVAMDPLTRRFCDELGWLNQALAQHCHRVMMSVAGLPLVLKDCSRSAVGEETTE
ncbi:MAG: bifunctional adenosylcobinamide kinase/adenosylcobinamide-phosphate guanylyltransferase [Marinobacter sp.]|uniref:bifunctional adenosylcobinamide kinase/adenosylcobinamide-phosphate guanylyltransferase n=1 Tax=Marinobacter sp. TaxID=50741 RepID=UPI00349FDFFA